MSKDNAIVFESDGRRKGFAGPNYTQVPNEIMDRWLPDLTGAELKILLYLARRTFGFHRDCVEIGLRRICNGIPGKDMGTGLHIETARSRRSLEAKGLVTAKRRTGGRTTYTLSVMEVYGKSEHPCSEIPNSTAFGKSVHEERKSSSERNVQKQRFISPVEPRQAPKLVLDSKAPTSKSVSIQG